MPLDPSIPLSVKPIDIQSPAQTIGTLMQLRGQQSQIALRNAQIQTQQAQNADLQAQADQRNADLKDQNTIQQGMLDPGVSARVHTGDLSDFEGKVQPKTLNSVQQTTLTNLQNLATLTKDQVAVKKEGLSRVLDTLNSLNTLKTPDGKLDLSAINTQLPGAVAELTSNGALKDSGVQAPIPKTITDENQLKGYIAMIGGGVAALDKSLAQNKETAAAAASQSTADLNAAKVPQVKAEGQIAQQKADAQKAALSNLDQTNTSIDGMISPTDHPKENKAAKIAYQNALAVTGDPAKALEEVDKIAQPIRSQDAEMAPDVLRKRLALHVQEAQATNKMELDRQVAAAKLLRAGDNPAVQHVAPADISRVTASAQKLDQQAIAAKSATESLGRVLDLAESGNTAAGHNVPLVSVGSLNAINHIKRMNSTEITSNSNLGNLYDRVVGKIQGLTEGQPIPKDVLDDIRTLHQSLGEQGYQEYTQGLDALNARSQSEFKPVIEAPKISKASSGGYKANDTRNIGGVNYTRDDKGNWNPTSK